MNTRVKYETSMIICVLSTHDANDNDADDANDADDDSNNDDDTQWTIHDYIGSLASMPNEPKTVDYLAQCMYIPILSQWNLLK